jgi:hypothetical protein
MGRALVLGDPDVAAGIEFIDKAVVSASVVKWYKQGI